MNIGEVNDFDRISAAGFRAYFRDFLTGKGDNPWSNAGIVA